MRDDSAKRPPAGEVAALEKDIDIFSGWLSRLENPDAVLREESAGRGVRIYEEISRDAQVFAMHQTRTLALQACEWQCDPATEKRADAKIADFVKAVLASANFDRLCRDLCQAVITGYKPVEVMWEASGGDIWIREFRGRRPGRFVFDPKGNLRLLTPSNLWDGEIVPDKKFVLWSYGGHDSNPYGRGLGHQLYWPVWFKKCGLKFWMSFLEDFGEPVPVGKSPPGAPPEDKDLLLEIVSNVRRKTGIAISSAAAIELLEAKRAGDGAYEKACSYFDGCIAKIILGQTLTSDQGERGSQSLGNVHERVLQTIVAADADDQCEVLNRTLVRWIVDLNFGPQPRGGYPSVWRRTEPERDLLALAGRDKILLGDLDFKRRVPETYFETTYGLPLAKEGERTIGQGDSREDAKARSDALPAAEFSEGRFDSDQEALERLVADVLPEGVSAMDASMRMIVAAIEASASPDDLADRLADAFGQILDERAMLDVIQRATVAAEMYGRHTARREALPDSPIHRFTDSPGFPHA